MANLQLSGILVEIGDTKQVTEKFRKREFVLDISEENNGTVYINYAKLQMTQAKCDVLDSFRVGDAVTVSFNVRGNKLERDGKVSYISNLDAWRIERAGSDKVDLYEPNTKSGGCNEAESINDSSLPF